jgi:hypothetical protein
MKKCPYFFKNIYKKRENKRIQVHKELESLAFLLYNIRVEINKKKELLKR